MERYVTAQVTPYHMAYIDHIRPHKFLANYAQITIPIVIQCSIYRVIKREHDQFSERQSSRALLKGDKVAVKISNFMSTGVRPYVKEAEDNPEFDSALEMI